MSQRASADQRCTPFPVDHRHTPTCNSGKRPLIARKTPSNLFPPTLVPPHLFTAPQDEVVVDDADDGIDDEVDDGGDEDVADPAADADTSTSTKTQVWSGPGGGGGGGEIEEDIAGSDDESDYCETDLELDAYSDGEEDPSGVSHDILAYRKACDKLAVVRCVGAIVRPAR